MTWGSVNNSGEAFVFCTVIPGAEPPPITTMQNTQASPEFLTLPQVIPTSIWIPIPIWIPSSLNSIKFTLITCHLPYLSEKSKRLCRFRMSRTSHLQILPSEWLDFRNFLEDNLGEDQRTLSFIKRTRKSLQSISSRCSSIRSTNNLRSNWLACV